MWHGWGRRLRRRWGLRRWLLGQHRWPTLACEDLGCVGPDRAVLIPRTGNSLHRVPRDRHDLSMLAQTHPQFSPWQELIKDHDIEELPGIDELRSVRSHQPDHGHSLEQGHFWVNDVGGAIPDFRSTHEMRGEPGLMAQLS